MKIRTTSNKDLDQIRQLFFETVTEVNCRDYDADQVAAWASGYKDSDDWLKKMEEQYFLVAETGGTIIGFCSLTSAGYLDFLYVHKDHQGRGIATKLLEVIKKIAGQMNIGEIRSDVSITALPFFEKHGFELIVQQTVNLRGILLTNFKMIQTVDKII